MNNKKYSGLDLTPRLFEKILVELFDGKQFKRKDAIDAVVNYYLDNGGTKSEKRDHISVFKKAVGYLKDSGIENVGYGTWQLMYHREEIEEIVKEDKPREQILIDKEVGSGNQSVYVYYFDIYKKYAETNNMNVWPCKVGCSEVNPVDRIISQAKTAYPEEPHISLLIKCDDSHKLESAIHSILKYQGAWLESAPGTEWFETSTERVLEIYRSINK